MYYRTTPTRRRSSGCSGRLLMAAAIAAFSLFSYFSSRQDNPVTGETQYVDITPEQEIALGLEAAPQMAAEFGGLDENAADQALVDEIGNRIVLSSPAGRSPYEFDFHLLDDDQTINAFALPGGQIFITRALYDRLQTEEELAGVLGHEIAHVVARHSAEHIAKAKLTEGLTGAAVIAAYDPNNPSSASRAQIALLIGQLINLKFGRDDELESDYLGVCFMHDSGYDPNALVRVMEVLASAQTGDRPPEFFSTHPNPENRIQRIQQAVQNVDTCP
ncbi:MAG TPA: M48 family metalloprotease [Anaerolineales bacterium]|nr:M48 family metalloprotease [Anaerolineales bacterium]